MRGRGKDERKERGKKKGKNKNKIDKKRKELEESGFSNRLDKKMI